MNLNETPDTVLWPETHYLFLERVGSFQQNAPQVWQALHALIPAIARYNTITGYMSLFKVGPQIYRAGVSLAAPPMEEPDVLSYHKFPGGRYSRFVLTGSYANLPRACGRVFDLAVDLGLRLRDGFNIENYVSDPRVTPEDELVTEILLPIV